MIFNNSLECFQYLLRFDESKMRDNLLTVIDSSHELYNDVLLLIQAHEDNLEQTQFNDLIHNKASNLIDNQSVYQLLGEQLGPYKLTALLGEGGMGVVYLGERNDGVLQQKVAIKMLFPSIAYIAGSELLQREAQHLANIEHNNIAKIFTVDTTLDGIAYMVMEYIEGSPVDEYCRKNNLTERQTLKLFKKVCLAVNEAHQNMVVHADIKPSNILVDKQGEPKLMDFGIARNLSSGNAKVDASQCNVDMNAASGGFASPEQLDGDKLMPSCDIYALGKLLKLVIKQKSDELDQVISLATQSLPKDRYNSVQSLNEDISNYLGNRPLKAIPASYFYLGKKFITRNPFPVATFTLFIAFLLIFNSILMRKNEQLVEEKSLSDSVLAFMMNTFEAGNPELSFGKTVTAKDLLEQASAGLQNEFTEKPQIKSRIQRTMAQAYNALGEYSQAIPLLEAALVAEQDDAVRAKLLMALGESYYQLAKYQSASDHYQQAQGIYRKTKNQEQEILAKLMHTRTLTKLGQFDLALKQQQEVLLAFEEVSGKQSENVALALIDISQTLVEKGDYDTSLEKRFAALEIRQELYSKNHYKVGDNLLDIGTMLHNMGKYEQGLEYQQQGVAVLTAIYGEQHPKIASYANDIASSYAALGQFEKSIETHKQAINIFEGFYGKEHIDIAYAYTYLANTQIDVKAYKEAISNFERSLAISLSVANEQHHAALAAINGLAICYTRLENFDKAKQFFEQAVTGLTSNNGEFHPRVAISKFNLARVVIKLDEFDYAKQLAFDAKAVFVKTYGEEHLYTETVNKFLLELEV